MVMSVLLYKIDAKFNCVFELRGCAECCRLIVSACFLHLQGISISTVWIWAVMSTFWRCLLPPNTAHISAVQSAKSEVNINSI
jgi:hypothetical protein